MRRLLAFFLLFSSRSAFAQVEPPPFYVGKEAPAAAEGPAVPSVPDEVQSQAEAILDPDVSWSLESLDEWRAITSPGNSSLGATLILKGLALEPERWPASFRASMRPKLAERLAVQSRTARERARTNKAWADRLEALHLELWTPPPAPPKLKIEGKKRGTVHWETLHKLYAEAGEDPVKYQALLEEHVVGHFQEPENNPHAADYTLNVIVDWYDRAGKLPRPQTLAPLINRASASRLDGPKGRRIFRALEGDPHLAPQGGQPLWYDPSPKAEQQALTTASHYNLQSKGLSAETHEQRVAWLAKCDAVSREFMEESLAMVHRWNRNGWRIWTTVVIGLGAALTAVGGAWAGIPIALFGFLCAMIFPKKEAGGWLKALKEHFWNIDPEIQESFRELDREFTADHEEEKLLARFSTLPDPETEAAAEAEAAEVEADQTRTKKTL